MKSKYHVIKRLDNCKCYIQIALYRNDLTWSYILVQPYLVLRHKMNLAPWFSQFVQSAVIVAWSHDLHWRGQLHIEKLSLVPYQNDQTNHLKYNINIYALFIVIWKIRTIYICLYHFAHSKYFTYCNSFRKCFHLAAFKYYQDGCQLQVPRWTSKTTHSGFFYITWF